MSSLIYIDDERISVEEGIVKRPTGTVLGLRDQDLTPGRTKALNLGIGRQRKEI